MINLIEKTENDVSVLVKGYSDDDYRWIPLSEYQYEGTDAFEINYWGYEIRLDPYEDGDALDVVDRLDGMSTNSLDLLTRIQDINSDIGFYETEYCLNNMTVYKNCSSIVDVAKQYLKNLGDDADDIVSEYLDSFEPGEVEPWSDKFYELYAEHMLKDSDHEIYDLGDGMFVDISFN